MKANYSGYPDTSGNSISYDENGNMTSHNDKGILELRYNILDLPSYIKFNNYVERLGQNVYRNLTYSYRADGVKIKKVHHYFSGKNKSNAYSTTEYIDGFQYSDDQFGFVGPPVLKFFATSEGYFDYQNNRYIYHYTDHLGNGRVSFTREGSEAIIVDKNDYYAFGLKHGGPTLDATGVNYRYQYNGKEMQDEIGMYDYGARFYMPDLGRWGVIDPLAESYRSYSPYHYAMNNPMRFIDPDGRTAMDTMMQLGGTWQNVGFGFFNAELGKYIDYEGNIMNVAQVLESRSFINGGGGAGAGGGDSFISMFFENGGSAIGLLTMIQQLKNAGFDDPINTKARFEDVYCLIEKIPSLVQLYCTIEGTRFNNDPQLATPGKAAYYDVYLNANQVKNILDYAFNIGHEMTHSFTDIYFKSKFFEIMPENGRYMRDHTYTYFSEVMGISWELQYGQNRYGDLSSDAAVRKYYRHIDTKAMDRVDPHLKLLMSEWIKMYNSKTQK